MAESRKLALSHELMGERRVRVDYNLAVLGEKQHSISGAEVDGLPPSPPEPAGLRLAICTRN